MTKGLLATFKATATADSELPPAAVKVQLQGQPIWQFQSDASTAGPGKHDPPRVPADLRPGEAYLTAAGKLCWTPTEGVESGRQTKSPAGLQFDSPGGQWPAFGFCLSRAAPGIIETAEESARRRLALQHEMAETAGNV